jgi:hypothetical protein
MATKTIVSETVTFHVPGPNYKPFRSTPEGKLIPNSGKYDIVEVKPGTPVEFDEAEADKFISRGIAKGYVEPVVESSKVVAVVADNKQAK